MKYYTKLFKRLKGISRKWNFFLHKHTMEGKKLKHFYFQNQYRIALKNVLKQRKNQFDL